MRSLLMICAFGPRINSLFGPIKRTLFSSPAENTDNEPSGVGGPETDCAPAYTAEERYRANPPISLRSSV